MCLPGRRLTISSIEHTMVAARNSTVFFFLFFFTLLKTPRCYSTDFDPNLADARLAFEKDLQTKTWDRRIQASSSIWHTATRRRSVAIIFEWDDIAVAWPIVDRAPAWLQPIVEDAFAASLAGLRSCLREGACALFLGMCISETVSRRLLFVSCSPVGSGNAGNFDVAERT